MKITQQLTHVTPRELHDILDQLDPEQTTHLGIVGPEVDYADDYWPDLFQDQPVYKLRENWSETVNSTLRFRYLQHLILCGLYVNDNDAFAIAEAHTQLQSLDVWYNQIGEPGVSAIAERLAKIVSLNLGDNRIGKVGVSAIAKGLSHLTSLSVFNNQIGEDGAIAIANRLKKLTELNVSHNQIGKAGGLAISKNLSQLSALYIEDRHILKSRNRNPIGQEVVDSIGAHLRLLSFLSIAGNERVRDISPLRDLPYLKQLDVSSTSVSDLEPFIERIVGGWPVYWGSRDNDSSWHNGLEVTGCPLTRPTVEIAQQGPEAVQNYFRELAAQGEDYLYEAKVLILGEGGSGKTSLLRRLYQPDKELPKEDETTRGIDIHRQDFVGNHGQPFRLNVWDFGGQQIYHATHQFFLTKNSLYVLVDDTRKDDKTIHDEGFKFWLEVVETLSENSPLLIFQNEKGDRSKTIDQPGIQGRFTNVQSVHRGNLDRVDSVKPLKQAIECLVQQLPHIGERVPKKWVSIRQELEVLAREKPFISQDDYFEVYRHHLPFDRIKALHLSRYLHDLGVFLHFQDDPLLSKTVILQNQWATEAVFRVLDDETVKSNHGRFTAADCRRLWENSTYADMHFELRGLMEKFELCYRLAVSAEELWLAPQLLSPSKPVELAQWAKPDDLVARFKYPFLPRGLVSRIMVRQHRFVRQLGKCWAHGAFFEHHGTEVLVEETVKGNEIELRARGPEHKALLSVLSNELEALNDRFKGLRSRVERLVPCVCSLCRQTTEPEMFEHNLLVNRQHSGKKKTIECRKSEEDVSLLELLDGLKIDQLPTWATKPSQPQGLKTVKIFLASSSELREDRDEFDLYFRQQNDHLKNKGVYLQIVRWEHFIDAISETRLQDEYNKALRNCDIVVCLFKTKVGKFTEEEFDVALQELKTSGTPKIFTFFRTFQLTNDEIKSKQKDLDSLHTFQQRLSDVGHFYTTYDDAEHLKRQFRDQLTRLGILN